LEGKAGRVGVHIILMKEAKGEPNLRRDRAARGWLAESTAAYGPTLPS